MHIKSIVIRKRTLGLIALTILGLGLISVGLYGSEFKQWILQVSGIEYSDNMNIKVNNPEGLKIDVNESKKTEKEQTTAEFFVDYRLQRERMRGQQVELLREIINNPESSAETRQKAQNQLLIISQNINKEMEVENLIRAKGFKDSVVVIKEQSVTVIVQSPNLSSEEAARISDLVSRSTGVSLQNVVIIPKP
ncbi:SpoIIIAH-like family protein [Desulfolucanica intricata]|uniref:SpoIIIAH-like family protein n=1 Tax=Desulfolucanica intricata TaxID=1285191 RepID=UPI00082EC0A4|nr:SpoIIIAH-like family protein [Desulfolucanica intricata]